jgi:hypothetical protein
MFVVLLYNVVFYHSVFGYYLILIPFILSGITIYVNVIDYNKFNELSTEDYLESKHKASVNYTDEVWNICKRFDKHLPNSKTEAIKYTKGTIQYKIQFNILIGQLNSILEFEHINDKININIKKQYISVLPDRGVNLRIIKQTEKKLNRIYQFNLFKEEIRT